MAQNVSRRRNRIAADYELIFRWQPSACLSHALAQECGWSHAVSGTALSCSPAFTRSDRASCREFETAPVIELFGSCWQSVPLLIWKRAAAALAEQLIGSPILIDQILLCIRCLFGRLGLTIVGDTRQVVWAGERVLTEGTSLRPQSSAARGMRLSAGHVLEGSGAPPGGREHGLLFSEIAGYDLDRRRDLSVPPSRFSQRHRSL